MQIRLRSTEMVYTPGIIKFVMQLASEGNVSICHKLLEAYNLKEEIRTGLITGTLPYRIEGDCVIISQET
jgi:hypothetical protein